MFSDSDDTFTTLRSDEDLKRGARHAREQTPAQKFGKVFSWLFSGFALAVVVALAFEQYSESLARQQELPGLMARGRRIPAQLSGAPVASSGGSRLGIVGARWIASYSYAVDGRTYTGSAHMHVERPDSITVVFDPQNPAAHRVDGALDPSAVNGQRLLWLGLSGLALGLFFLSSGPLEWLSRRK